MGEIFSNVEIEINTECNRKCSYCPNSKHNNIEKKHMKKEMFERIVNELCKVFFCGRLSYHFYNEPLLCENIIYFVTLAKKKLPKCKQVLYSNGDRLDKALFVKLLESGADLFVITNHNEIDELEMHPFYKVYYSLSEEEKKHVVYLTKEDLNLTNRGGTLTNLGDNENYKMPCYMMKSLIVIDVDGNVISCFEDYYKKMTVGNIGKSSLLDIWNDKNYMEIREELSRGNRLVSNVCKKCNNYSMVNEMGKYDYIL